MSSSPSNDDDFVTKTTKHRKKQQQQQQAAAGSDAAKKPPTGPSNGAASSSSSSNSSSNISLRPRTMFAMKGRGRTESEGSAYRPQWSKDGEGFVSSAASGAGGPTSFKDAATGGGGGDDHRGERRKSKVLRYTKEELLALHFTTAEAPAFPPDTSVASEHSLPPVSTLPFDYEEIYKQWSLNRNRGRGRGRGNAPSGGAQGARGGHQERGARGDDADAAKQQKEEHHRHNEKESTWERGAKITETSHGDDVWDDVLEPGADSNEMDLSSMAEAAEKFRREMDAMREELQGPKIDPDEMDLVAPDAVKKSFDLLLNSKRGDISMSGLMFTNRFEGPNRIAMVRDYIAFLPTAGLHMRCHHWTIVTPSGADDECHIQVFFQIFMEKSSPEFSASPKDIEYVQDVALAAWCAKMHLYSHILHDGCDG